MGSNIFLLFPLVSQKKLAIILRFRQLYISCTCSVTDLLADEDTVEAALINISFINNDVNGVCKVKDVVFLWKNSQRIITRLRFLSALWCISFRSLVLSNSSQRRQAAVSLKKKKKEKL